MIVCIDGINCWGAKRKTETLGPLLLVCRFVTLSHPFLTLSTAPAHVQVLERYLRVPCARLEHAVLLCTVQAADQPPRHADYAHMPQLRQAGPVWLHRLAAKSCGHPISRETSSRHVKGMPSCLCSSPCLNTFVPTVSHRFRVGWKPCLSCSSLHRLLPPPMSVIFKKLGRQSTCFGPHNVF